LNTSIQPNLETTSCRSCTSAKCLTKLEREGDVVCAGVHVLPKLQGKILDVGHAIEKADRNVDTVSLGFEYFCEHHDLEAT
jgi:hypothetical protein